MANRPGDFIWYELMSADAKASEAFYGPLLGWRFAGTEEYREIEASDGAVGGILPLTPEMTAAGARPAWVGYLQVDDVDAMLASVEGAGGRAHMPARTMEGVGRLAMVADPQGAPFYIIARAPAAGRESIESHAFSYDRPRVGHCAWNELATSDPAAAFRFYGPRFGWVKDGELDMGESGKYEFVRHVGRAPDGSPMGHGMLGAIMPKPPEMPVSAWTHYFRVADIDVARARIEAGGGRVLRGPDEIPGGDFSMNAVDPQGAVFALVGSRRK